MIDFENSLKPEKSAKKYFRAFNYAVQICTVVFNARTSKLEVREKLAISTSQLRAHNQSETTQTIREL